MNLFAAMKQICRRHNDSLNPNRQHNYSSPFFLETWVVLNLEYIEITYCNHWLMLTAACCDHISNYFKFINDIR